MHEVPVIPSCSFESPYVHMHMFIQVPLKLPMPKRVRVHTSLYKQVCSCMRAHTWVWAYALYTSTYICIYPSHFVLIRTPYLLTRKREREREHSPFSRSLLHVEAPPKS